MRRSLAAVPALLVLGVSLAAQAPDTTYLRGLEWRNLGPNRGGRSIAVAGSTRRPLEYYFGATGGGLWKTTDGGLTWRPVTDGQLRSASVGAVAVCEANPDVVYLGTGEVQLRGNVQPGDGVYKSSDGGRTWAHVGLREARNIARIRIDPTNCDRVFVAAFGDYGVPNPNRGIYRSTDGGRTWQRVLFRNDSTGGVDISINPRNPNEIYAALWQAYRKTWELSSGGPGSGLFKSTDGGSTWTELTRNPGMPQNQLIGKIGVSVSPADPNRVYAIVEPDSGGVFRSDDGGRTWTRTNSERKLRQRAFYYTRIYADPQNRDVVYVLNVAFWKSTDGGRTFPRPIRVPHGDNHDLWIAADNPQRMIEGNDGGANVTTNGGETWTEQDYPTAQIYRVTLTNHQPPFACGGQQDNSTVCVPVRDWNHLLARGGANQQYFYAVGGCESGYVAHHPRKPNLYFAGCYGGVLTRYDHETGQTQSVSVWPENVIGEPSRSLRERFQWTFPIVFDPFDPNVLYATSQHVWRSTDEGRSWERISPDLTRADPATMGPSGGPITKDMTGVETYATIFAFAPSPLERGVLWAGSDDGLVHLSRDAGRSWQNVTPPDLPAHTKITTIEPSRHRPGTAYLTAHRFLLGDYRPYVYRTTDYGRTWTRIDAGLPTDEIARSIREDPTRAGLLYLGTERGVWVSWDDGGSWSSLQRNLPVVQVADLAVNDRDLVIATHGRSFWALFNLAPVRQWRPEIARERFHLFQPEPAYRGLDPGVAIDYTLQRAGEAVTLEFLDAQGRLIRRITSRPPTAARDTGARTMAVEQEDEGPRPSAAFAPNRAGLNRFVWDLRHPPFRRFPGLVLWAGSPIGPAVPPGRYQVRLTIGGRSQTQSFEVRLDPRLQGKVTQADLERRYGLARQVYDAVNAAHDAVARIRSLRAQIDSVRPRVRDAALQQRLREFTDSLTAVEATIYETRLEANQDALNFGTKLNNKLANLLAQLEQAEAAPTRPQEDLFQALSAQLQAALARLDRALAGLPELNTALRRARLPELRPAAPDTDRPTVAAGEPSDEDGLTR